ncbi:Glycosyltransferase involved in cell wall bisynthesis [Actinokineospora alba]|uniref:Glycosyltransferase involved in cell wall bisynthesis n=1 Tax=Actinokineospora alba TaxID=504798 RepID=A0A1H0PHA1_9PSEU|nr:glycosyltransferase family 4 protein [Actinokineospora alba]TDP65789.1 glycosyltransferase involved in cell wall biosynthesis [Actinokineospora alba]SDI65108.1 Glycosyltransferase involved in cell wall bisynthesis [Actinokineospora alba]SDP04150.1 Glycosyltransferase involved in cell wall bisynthesis [Actinokineospora alba]
MKILVFAHRLELGGTQTNAIELAATVRDQFGHDVVLFAAPGPAVALAEQKGLRLIEAPDAQSHPSPAVMRALRAAVRTERPDLIHVWDWPQCFDAYYGEHLLRGVPILCTMMGMVVPRFLPRHLTTTFGTRQLVDEARAMRAGRVELLEPPVDTDFNAPGAVDSAPFRAKFGLDDGKLNLVTVSRLTEWLKLESLQRSIAAVDLLAEDLPVRLVLVGEGTAAERVGELANRVNDRHGTDVVVMTGGMIDPRPAYDCADLMLGMGGSALRSLAFAKPIVVLGERGFSLPYDETSAGYFGQWGYYGLGTGDLSAEPLAEQIRPLLLDPDRRAELGAFGRSVVTEHYGLAPAARGVERLYREVAAAKVSRSTALREGVRTAALLAGRRLPEPLKNNLRGKGFAPRKTAPEGAVR